jgi:pyrimidine operon attenuation protein/uracil phosphoribosyltransferase
MATTDLSTTNLFLGLIAISSLVQMLAFGVVCAGVLIAVARLNRLIKTVQEQQLPLAAVRLHAILDDVKGVTSTAKTQADRFEGLAQWALRAIRRCAGDV